jgi:exonuclease III
LRLYHQNIRGLNITIEELTTQWTTQFPHLLCFTEYYLKESKINNIYIKHYKLGVSYCRQSHTHGGVDIFMYNTLSYSTINLNKICNNHDFEACAIKLIISTNIYYMVCIYRPPAGYFTTF